VTQKMEWWQGVYQKTLVKFVDKNHLMCYF
jgi:hypothetical protein